MQIRTTRLAGPVLFVPTVHRDDRGFFTRTCDAETMRRAGLDPLAFCQDSQSRSRQGVLRGLHGRSGAGEAKLVRVAHGRVFDVVVDARAGSPTFGQWESFLLDDDDCQVLYVPRGFLHGHLTLSPSADVAYRIDATYDPSADIGVHFGDPDLAIDWPNVELVVSERDAGAGSWRELVDRM